MSTPQSTPQARKEGGAGRWRGVRGVVAAALLALVAVAPASRSAAREPQNLDTLKDEIRAYIDSGEYDREIARVMADASGWLEQRSKQGGGKLAVVFDLDETFFSNLPLIRSLGFGYTRPTWTAWVDDGKAPALVPVRELYFKARALGVNVIFLSGRRERDRPGSLKNLQALGCGEYAAAVFKPDAWKKTNGEFKRGARERLAAEGYVIIANVGDQESDFEGGLAERNFKLPNPFYLSK
jgi:predicted secreted acid phosphatase